MNDSTKPETVYPPTPRPTMGMMTEKQKQAYFAELATEVESMLPSGPSIAGHALFTLIVFDGEKEVRYVGNTDTDGIAGFLRSVASHIETGRQSIEGTPVPKPETTTDSEKLN